MEKKIGVDETIRSFQVFPGQEDGAYVLVLSDPLEKTLRKTPKLRIFRGNDLREVFAREGFLLRLLDPTGKDINSDGHREVALSISNGGNCLECTSLEILSLRDEGVLSLYNDEASFPQDLDGDGLPEIVRSRYALGNANYKTLSHYDQITEIEVLAWTGSRYAVQNSGYKAFFEARIERLKAQLESGVSPTRAFSLAARTLLLRLKTAGCQDAWLEFRRNLPDLTDKEDLERMALALEQGFGCQ